MTKTRCCCSTIIIVCKTHFYSCCKRPNKICKNLNFESERWEKEVEERTEEGHEKTKKLKDVKKFSFMAVNVKRRQNDRNETKTKENFYLSLLTNTSALSLYDSWLAGFCFCFSDN
jgi:hypothetical protein